MQQDHRLPVGRAGLGVADVELTGVDLFDRVQGVRRLRGGGRPGRRAAQGVPQAASVAAPAAAAVRKPKFLLLKPFTVAAPSRGLVVSISPDRAHQVQRLNLMSAIDVIDRL